MNDCLIIEKVILDKMEAYFGSDIKRICHARRVLEHAKEISKEEGGNILVVIASAILHDIGIKECERKFNSTGGQLQEKEGPAIARDILGRLDLDKQVILQVCRIIASHHSPGEVNTLNFKILWDADWLVNLKDEYNITDKKALSGIIEKTFLTKTGKLKARKVYIEDGKE